MVSLSHIYIDALYEDGNRCYDDLSTEQKAKLTGLIMKESSFHYRCEFVTESDLFEGITLDIADCLISLSESADKCKETKERLHQNILANSVFYARNAIDLLFKTMKDSEDFYKQNETGVKKHGNYQAEAA